MSSKVPHAAFCEEYDEDAHEILPETRQVANITAKRSKTDLRVVARPLAEAASDSGYSSRTAATVNSTQSAPLGRKSPVPLKIDTSLKKVDSDRVRSKGKDRTRARSAHPAREEKKMQVGPYPPAGHPQGRPQRSPSRSQRRERSHLRHYPGTCWECDQGLYHDSTPFEPEPRQMEYPYYPSQPPSIQDYPPPSPHAQRYPPSAVVQVSQSNRPQGRMARSNSYHSNNRPLSFHGIIPGMGGMAYNPSPISSRYDHSRGPPPSSSAYINTPSYGPPPPPSHYPQQSSYYGPPDPTPPPEPQERSVSRTREPPRGRRPSIFEAPVLDFESSSDEDEEPMEQPPAPPPPPPQPRQRLPSHSSHDRDEDYYRMPPPPLKHKAPPRIIQKRPEMPRKSATAPSVTSERRPSRSLDLSDIRDALPEYGYQRSSRETVIPERTRSIRDNRRPAAYHDSGRSARIAVENSRRRRPIVYDDYASDEMEDKQRDAEEYQASQAPKPVPVPVPLTADALYKAKASQRPESDSGSQKSRSNSSRGSDARTQNGSRVGSQREEEDNNNIVMTMNGVTMSFTPETVGGKKISVRTGETGALELNIEGKRPKKYLTSGSEYTSSGSVARREFDELRRPRNDRKSDRASRRSSRSTYSAPRY